MIENKTPGSLTKEETQLLYDYYISYMDTNAFTGSNDRSVVSMQQPGLYLFGTGADDVDKRGFLVDVYTNLGASCSNTLISKFNIVYNTSAVQNFPWIAETDYYKAFNVAASEANSGIVEDQFVEGSNKIGKLITKYEGYLNSDYKSYVDGLKKKSVKDIGQIMTKFENLCKLAYNFDKDFADIQAVDNPDNPVVSITTELSSTAQIIQSTERTRLENVVKTFIDYARKMYNIDAKQFSEKYGNFNDSWREAGFDSIGIVYIGADLLGIDLFNLD